MASERKYFFDSTCVALAPGSSTTSQAVQRFYEEKSPSYGLRVLSEATKLVWVVSIDGNSLIAGWFLMENLHLK